MKNLAIGLLLSCLFLSLGTLYHKANDLTMAALNSMPLLYQNIHAIGLMCGIFSLLCIMFVINDTVLPSTTKQK